MLVAVPVRGRFGGSRPDGRARRFEQRPGRADGSRAVHMAGGLHRLPLSRGTAGVHCGLRRNRFAPIVRQPRRGGRRSSGQLSGFDHVGRDVAQLAVQVLRRPPEEVERLVLGTSVRGSSAPPWPSRSPGWTQRGFQLLGSFALDGSGHRDRGVCGQHRADRVIVLVERRRPSGVQVQRADRVAWTNSRNDSMLRTPVSSTARRPNAATARRRQVVDQIGRRS